MISLQSKWQVTTALSIYEGEYMDLSSVQESSYLVQVAYLIRMLKLCNHVIFEDNMGNLHPPKIMALE